MKLIIYRERSGFDALRAEWNALLAQSAADTIFLSWEWQTTWWKHWATDDLWLLSWRDDAGQLLGIAPLFMEKNSGDLHRLLLVGGTEVSDYLDFIVVRGHEDAIYASFCDWLISKDAPTWDLLELVNVPVASSTRTRLAAQLATHWKTEITKEDVCPQIQLPADWDTYLNSLDKHQRHEVRRKLRRIEESANVQWHISASMEAVERDIEDFIALHQLSSADKDDFMTEPMKAYFRDVARELFSQDALALSILTVDGQPASALFSLLWRDQWLLYNSGYDPVNFKELSTGVVLQARTIEYAIQNQYRVFDFLQGDENYKYRLGGKDTEVYRITVTRQ